MSQGKKISYISTITQSMRIPFLILTPVCVLLGTSTVIANKVEVNILFVILALLGALFAHISVNSLNEYSDFKSGLDLTTNRTPFSGGSGSLPNHPEAAIAVLITGISSIVIISLIGIFFIWQHGTGIIPLGFIGLLLVVTYTNWINKYPWLCLVAPGLGFGLLMVVGTQFVVEGEYSTLSFLIAVIPFLLINNLLLLNQYPDIEADKMVGRRHFPITYGIEQSNKVYAATIVLTIATIIVYIGLEILPLWSLLALLPIPLSLFSLSGAIKYGKNIGGYPQYLAANVAVTVLVPLILGASIILG